MQKRPANKFVRMKKDFYLCPINYVEIILTNIKI